jgi:hypothetical protein
MSDPIGTRRVLDGIHCIKTSKNVWAPDYSVPGTAEAVKKSVDEAYDAHYPISKLRG